MSAITSTRHYAPEELLALPDEKDYELVDGQLVARNMGWEASWIAGRLYFFLSMSCDKNRRGWVAPADASYQCYRDAPNKVRKTDVSFIRLERLEAARLPKGHCRIAPDLAAEVVSPNDLYSGVEAKAKEYLQAGVALVWIIDPPTRSVRVHRADGSVTDLTDKDELDGENVIPGFRCKISDLFDCPSPPADAS